jgi:hypothetical protein
MPSKMERVRQAAERVARAKGVFARASERLLDHMKTPHPYLVCRFCEDFSEVVETARAEMHKEIQVNFR